MPNTEKEAFELIKDDIIYEDRKLIKNLVKKSLNARYRPTTYGYTKMADFICPVCTKKFTKKALNSFLNAKASKRSYTTCCSRSCSRSLIFKTLNMTNKEKLLFSKKYLVKVYEIVYAKSYNTI